MAEIELREKKGGISEEIFDNPHYVGVISGLSGKTELNVLLNKLHVSFVDNLDPNLHFNADVNGNSLSFSIQTKGYMGDPTRKHPDLYAADLAHKAYEYLLGQGNNIEVVDDYWGDIPGRNENYLALKTNLEKIGISDPKQASAEQLRVAAENTWSGQMIYSLGFEKIDKVIPFGDAFEVYFSKQDLKSREKKYFWQSVLERINGTRRQS